MTSIQDFDPSNSAVIPSISIGQQEQEQQHQQQRQGPFSSSVSPSSQPHKSLTENHKSNNDFKSLKSAMRNSISSTSSSTNRNNSTNTKSICNNNQTRRRKMKNYYPTWRKEGMKLRMELLKQDEETGGSIFTINRHAKLLNYYQIADRVLTQFRDAIESKQNLQDTYLMGNRLVKFLDQVLPTHDSYNDKDPELMRLRIKSRNNLQLTKLQLEDVELALDKEFCVDHDLMQKEEENEEYEQHKEEKELKNGFAINSRFCQQDPDTSLDHDACTSASSSNSNTNSSSNLHQQITKRVRFAPQESFLTHVVDSASSSYPNPNDILSYENKIMSQSNEVFSTPSSSTFLNDFSENEFIFSKERGCHDWTLHPPENPHDIFCSDGVDDSGVSTNIFGSSSCLEADDDNDDDLMIHSKQPFDESVVISDEDSYGSESGSEEEGGDFYYTRHIDDSDNESFEEDDEEEELTFMEQIAHENYSQDMNALHDDEDDSDAVDSWAQSDGEHSDNDDGNDDEDSCHEQDNGSDDSNSTLGISRRETDSDQDLSVSHVLSEDGYIIPEEKSTYVLPSSFNPGVSNLMTMKTLNREEQEQIDSGSKESSNLDIMRATAISTDDDLTASPSRVFNKDGYYLEDENFAHHMMRMDYYSVQNALSSHLSSSDRSLSKSYSFGDESDEETEHEEFVKRMMELEFASDLESSGEKTHGTSETEAMTADSNGSGSYDELFTLKVEEHQDVGGIQNNDPQKIEHLEKKVKSLLLRRRSESLEPEDIPIVNTMDSKETRKLNHVNTEKQLDEKKTSLHPSPLQSIPATSPLTNEPKQSNEKKETTEDTTTSTTINTVGNRQRYSKLERLRRIKKTAHWQRRYGNRSQPEVNKQ